MSDHHVLKCKDPFFTAVQRGEKRFEVRQYTSQACRQCQACKDCCFTLCENPRPARDFKVGDTVRMHRDDSNSTKLFRIGYVLKDTDYPEGLRPGYCVLGLEDGV